MRYIRTPSLFLFDLVTSVPFSYYDYIVYEASIALKQPLVFVLYKFAILRDLFTTFALLSLLVRCRSANTIQLKAIRTQLSGFFVWWVLHNQHPTQAGSESKIDSSTWKISAHPRLHRLGSFRHIPGPGRIHAQRSPSRIRVKNRFKFSPNFSATEIDSSTWKFLATETNTLTNVLMVDSAQ